MQAKSLISSIFPCQGGLELPVGWSAPRRPQPQRQDHPEGGGAEDPRHWLGARHVQEHLPPEILVQGCGGH